MNELNRKTQLGWIGRAAQGSVVLALRAAFIMGLGILALTARAAMPLHVLWRAWRSNQADA
jgi:hypothetical protein